MAQLKSQPASRLRDHFSWLSKVYWNENIVWLPGYFVSSVGIDEKTIKQYVEHQGRQDSGQLQFKL
jgi:putative transposase